MKTSTTKKKPASLREIAALQRTARLASELCIAIDNEAEDIGGSRPVKDILEELGPACDASDKHLKVDPHPPYISVTSGMRGWFAVFVGWTKDKKSEAGGFYEPYHTGISSHPKRAGAVKDAKSWAEAEGVRFQP